MSGIQLILIPITTVGKIVMASALGWAVSRFFNDGDKSIKGFTFICVRVFLPCLLFANLCVAVTWESLSTYYAAFLMSLLPLILGYGCSRVVQPLLDREWAGVVMLGCTFQNGLVFPLSVVMNLKGIEWLSGEALQTAQEMMFLYNIISSCALWAIGEPLVRQAKLQIDAEAEEQAKLEQSGVVIICNYGVHPSSSSDQPVEHNIDASPATSTNLPLPISPFEHQDAHEVLAHYQPATAAPSTVIHAAAQPTSITEAVWASVQSPPVAASLVALTISLTPPLRWMMLSYPGQMIHGGLYLIGSGCIPIQMLVLGCTLAGPSSSSSSIGAPTAEEALMRDGDVVVKDDEHKTWCANMLKVLKNGLQSQVGRFTAITCLLRLVVVPLATLAVVHILFLLHWLPHEKPFILSLLIAISSPTAINSSLICSLHNYRAMEYARMIFIMYVCAIPTATMWLVFDLWYVEHFLGD